jgi:hypothetical protein
MRAPPSRKARVSGPGLENVSAINASGTQIDSFMEPGKQVRPGKNYWPVTKRWNRLTLDHSGKRWEIPDEIIRLAEIEPSPPSWWTCPPQRADRAIGLNSGSQTDQGRCFTAAEREAFIAARPDLLNPLKQPPKPPRLERAPARQDPLEKAADTILETGLLVWRKPSCPVLLELARAA